MRYAELILPADHGELTSANVIGLHSKTEYADIEFRPSPRLASHVSICVGGKNGAVRRISPSSGGSGHESDDEDSATLVNHEIAVQHHANPVNTDSSGHLVAGSPRLACGVQHKIKQHNYYLNGAN